MADIIDINDYDEDEIEDIPEDIINKLSDIEELKETNPK